MVKLTLGYDVYAGTTCNVQFTKGKLARHKAKDIDIQRYRRNSKQDFTYVNHDLGHCSCVDHFILSMVLIKFMYVLSMLFLCISISENTTGGLALSHNISALNPSDHCVVKLTLGYDVYAGTTCNVQFTKGTLSALASACCPPLTLQIHMKHKAKDIDIQRYRSELDALLAQCTLSNEIMQCTEKQRRTMLVGHVNCTCESHRLGIEVRCSVIQS